MKSYRRLTVAIKAFWWALRGRGVVCNMILQGRVNLESPGKHMYLVDSVFSGSIKIQGIPAEEYEEIKLS